MASRHKVALRRLGGRVGGEATRLSIDAFFHGLSNAGWHAPDGRKRRKGIRAWRDIPYRKTGERAHLLDVFKADWVEGPAPALLYIHGGGFSICSKDTHWALALPFARRGFVVFNINYRLAPKHKYPAAFNDACAALMWILREGAERFGADPRHLVLAGESAGANLATGLSMASSYRFETPWAREVFEAEHQPKATIAACGVLQVSDSGRFNRRRPERPGWQKQVLGAMEQAYLPPSLSDRDLPFADPLRVFEDRSPDRAPPAFFVFVGTRDFLLNDSRRLKAALDKRDVPCELRIYPEEMHGFHAIPWRDASHECWRAQDAFLWRHIFSQR